jgi:hypothetical protein
MALAVPHPTWGLGFGEEVWWSRLAQPAMHTWTPDAQVLRLIEKAHPKADPEPKALACYGLLMRHVPTQPEQMWHISHEVRTWLRQHNHHVKQTGHGVRILACRLPSKSPWLNPIEPKWVHGKRAIVEPDRLLSAQEVMDRVRAYHRCANEDHLSISAKVA